MTTLATSSPASEAVVRPFADAKQHRIRWRRLAQAIAASASAINDEQPAGPPPTPGSLEIIGSGIEAAGFTRADEARIRSADYVFFCVADPATKIWLFSERPDAYDLYVLYDDVKRRYLTYMQMTEAMLHYVRGGAYVVAVFYGHPGIFVLATHRAVQIARREGHRVVMRPAVSALDTLCADLGIDPSQPGMQMYEATDMLIRRRLPDPGLHLVLWQVGLIGELGYRRQGYLNGNFAVLLDYLESLYGPDHPVVNYVGSRVPGIDPVIDRSTVAALRRPEARTWVTGISTFYLPPRDVGVSDPAMLARLGLIRKGQPVLAAAQPLRVIDRYGPRERRAFSDFASFEVPDGYQWQPDTAAGRFVLALCDDAALRERYKDNAYVAVTEWPGAGGLTAHERRMLARRDAGSVQLAAKGAAVARPSGNRAVLLKLLSSLSATASLLKVVEQASPGTVHDAAGAWARALRLSVGWATMGADLATMLQSDLATWSGCYLDHARTVVLSILGQPGRAEVRVDVAGRRIDAHAFQRGVLTWEGDAGGTSGYLQADLSRPGTRSWTGLIWQAGETVSDRHKVMLREHGWRPPPCAAAGTYVTPRGTVEIRPDADTPEGVAIWCDGVRIVATPHLTKEGLDLGGWRLAHRERSREAVPDWACGHYHLRLSRESPGQVVPLVIGRDEITVDGVRIAPIEADGGIVRWSGAGGCLPAGWLAAVLDPITLRPLLHGIGHGTRSRIVLRAMGVLDTADVSRLVAVPRVDLPGWAWDPVVAIMAQASQDGGLFLWHGQERARVCLRRLRRVLALIRHDDLAADGLC